MAESSQTAKHAATLAIVGRPNVGKSTLFNRIVGRRRAIVGDEPGITRDRLYGNADWNGRRFRVIDTGGIIPEDKEHIPAEIFRQARVALEEADAIVMVVDGRTELAAPDMELARLLIRMGKPLYLAVNKVDTPKLAPYAENFRTLGIKNLFPISAEHSTGVAELLDEVVKVMPASEPEQEELTTEVTEEDGEQDRGVGPAALSRSHEDVETSDAVEPAEGGRPTEDLRELKIAIIGKPNVGKSTLLNALTSSDRAIISPIPGTTRDAVDEMIERDGQQYRFIDTAGIRRKGKTRLMAEKLSVVMARKHLEAADIALLVIDATEGVTALDATIAGYAHEAGRSVIIVINKWDLVGRKQEESERRTMQRPRAHAPFHRQTGSRHAMTERPDRADFEERVRHALKFLNYAPVLFVSAKEGRNIDKLFKSIGEVGRERRKRIPTSAMNRFLEHIDFDRASVPYNRRVRILYMTQAGTSPPTFVLFVDRAVKLHFSYERFLENQIRKSFGFTGTPIWIKTRTRS
ncbi:MAG: ribosome biogenesis GTPase Der [Terriglobales bacterium]